MYADTRARMHGQGSRQHVSKGVLIFFSFFFSYLLTFSLVFFCLLLTNTFTFGYLIISKDLRISDYAPKASFVCAAFNCVEN